MAFDLTRGYHNDLRERPLAAGATITEEAQCLVYVDAGDGTMAVQPSAGAGGERFAGFALTDSMSYVTAPVVEELVVPTGGGTSTLAHSSLVAGSTYAVASTSGALTEAASPPAAGQYSVDDSAGTAEFNAAQAGETVTIYYRYQPTLAEILATEHERSINNRAQELFSQVSVIGDGSEFEIFTTVYDSSQAYAVGGALYTGAAGLVTSAAGGTEIGFCSKVPSVGDAMLGVKKS
tara:strand:- start:120530 stop:121234 length:705 start_codon:yes stop_codon:yes gene_type:complete